MIKNFFPEIKNNWNCHDGAAHEPDKIFITKKL